MSELLDPVLNFFALYAGDAAALSTAFAWSAAVIFFRQAGYSVSPLNLNIFKSCVASVLFVISLMIAGGPWIPDLSWNDWLRLVISAVLGITLGDMLFLMSLNRLGAGLQAIVDCLYAPFVIVMAFVFLDETLPATALFGGALVVSAVLTAARLNSIDTQDERRTVVVGIAYGVAAQICVAVSIILIRDLVRSESILWITSFRFVTGSLLLFPIFFARSHSRIRDVFRPGPAWRPMILGAVLGPYLATIFWLLGFRHTMAGRAGIYNQLSTIIIIVLAAIFLHEPLTRRKLVAVTLGIAGGIVVALSA